MMPSVSATSVVMEGPLVTDATGNGQEPVAAVNARAVERLIVPGNGLVPGYVCGLLGTAADGCPDWEAAA